jgi:HD-GYP domain-containing protein (c-di-GMP phosphodiesterase class II)
MQSGAAETTDRGSSTIVNRDDRMTGWPIKLSIATVVVLAMLVLALVVIGLESRSARRSAIDSATKAAHDAGLLITEKSKNMLEPAQASLRLLANDSISGSTTLEDRLLRLRPLSEVLASIPLASAIYVGYHDGSFLLMRPLPTVQAHKNFDAPAEAQYLVQSVEVKPDGGRVGQFVFMDAGRGILERRVKDDYRFDPRTRPWFKSVSKAEPSQVSEPYIFFTTQQLGLTLSQAGTDGNAIFGIDVVLDDLAQALGNLKISPNTELALVDSQQKVMAYPDMRQVLVKGKDRIDFKSLNELGVVALTDLNALADRRGKVETFDVDGEEWLGFSLPFDAWKVTGMRLLVAAPSAELLGEARANGERMVIWALAVTILLMPLGWWAGASVGRSLDKLTAQAKRMGRFDFSQVPHPPNVILEANTLSEVMNDMGKTIQTFLQISQDMATEPKVERMLENVLSQMVTATRCTAGAVYLIQADAGTMRRSAAVGNLREHEEPGVADTSPGPARSSQLEVAPGIAEMRFELRGRSGDLQGLLVLQYTMDAGHADASFTEFVHKLSGMLAMSIETRQLIESQKRLLDAVVRLMADAIDAKSPYTGGHCERVPELAGMVVDQMRTETSGPYANFSMNEDQRYEFHLGAWLHDCGKVTSPEHIVDKATKLEVIYNRIHEVRMRFEVLWRDREIEHFRRVAAGQNADASMSRLAEQKQQLQSDFAFVARCNVGGEFMADETVQQLNRIAGQTWMRHFDDRLGLSEEESRRLMNVAPQAPSLPAPEQLLADRAEHIVPWGERKPAVSHDDPNNHHGFDMALPRNKQNMGELYNLAIRRGTLTEEDRFMVNDHIVQTLIMLRGLPWPSHLARVPEIAATHHEKINGRGFPRKLKGDQLTTVDRVMALADIFEALTAGDRPYKAAKTLNESMRIMASMCNEQHIDTELFRYFLNSNIWLTFARRYMLPPQIDNIDTAEIEKLLVQPAIPPRPQQVRSPEVLL